MASTPIVSWFGRFTQRVRRSDWLLARPDLHTLGANPVLLPPFVRESAVALRYLNLLSPLAWDRFPERNWLGNRRPSPTPRGRRLLSEAGSAACFNGPPTPIPGRTPGLALALRLPSAASAGPALWF